MACLKVMAHFTIASCFFPSMLNSAYKHCVKMERFHFEYQQNITCSDVCMPYKCMFVSYCGAGPARILHRCNVHRVLSLTNSATLF